MLYYAKIGKPFTDADLAYLQPKAKAEGPVVLPKVEPTTKPTKSPIPKHGGMPYVGSYPVRLFSSREDARKYGRAHSKRPMDLKTHFINASKSNIPDSARWFVFEK